MDNRVVPLYALTGLLLAACSQDSGSRHRPPPGDSALAVTAPASAQLAICDTVAHLLRAVASRHLRLVADTLVVNPGGGPAPWPRRGCQILVTDSIGEGWAATKDLGEWLRAHGFRSAPYSADGPDGTMFGLAREPELCLVEGHWDGGDDTDSTYVPRPGYDLTISCVPAAAGDTAQWSTGAAAQPSKPNHERS